MSLLQGVKIGIVLSAVSLADVTLGTRRCDSNQNGVKLSSGLPAQVWGDIVVGKERLGLNCVGFTRCVFSA